MPLFLFVGTPAPWEVDPSVGASEEELEEFDSSDHTPVGIWTFTGFHAFRKRVAEAIGVDLDTMYGYGGRRSWAEIDDTLTALLNHPDDSGVIDFDACRQLAPRLRAIVGGWDLEDPDRLRAEEMLVGIEQMTPSQALIFG